ncbi:hypothetical protein FQA39_LY15314 [Lamprigera yunnana]|nr:hypothetical protein FQA39_LY15314 [Lamprigera yunnana]
MADHEVAVNEVSSGQLMEETGSASAGFHHAAEATKPSEIAQMFTMFHDLVRTIENNRMAGEQKLLDLVTQRQGPNREISKQNFQVMPDISEAIEYFNGEVTDNREIHEFKLITCNTSSRSIQGLSAIRCNKNNTASNLRSYEIRIQLEQEHITIAVKRSIVLRLVKKLL